MTLVDVGRVGMGMVAVHVTVKVAVVISEVTAGVFVKVPMRSGEHGVSVGGVAVRNVDMADVAVPTGVAVIAVGPTAVAVIAVGPTGVAVIAVGSTAVAVRVGVCGVPMRRRGHGISVVVMRGIGVITTGCRDARERHRDRHYAASPQELTTRELPLPVLRGHRRQAWLAG